MYGVGGRGLFKNDNNINIVIIIISTDKAQGEVPTQKSW